MKKLMWGVQLPRPPSDSARIRNVQLPGARGLLTNPPSSRYCLYEMQWSTSLCWSAYHKLICISQTFIINVIIRKFSHASLNTKLMLFRAYCSPIYGCQLWSTMFQYSYSKLRVAYNDALNCLQASDNNYGLPYGRPYCNDACRHNHARSHPLPVGRFSRNFR